MDSNLGAEGAKDTIYGVRPRNRLATYGVGHSADTIYAVGVMVNGVGHSADTIYGVLSC